MKKPISILFISKVIFVSTITAQENQGAINDNYNPVNGQYINPSVIVDAKPWLDINLVGASAYLRNNYAYYPNTTLLNFNRFRTEAVLNGSVETINGYGDFMVHGPSASLVLGQHAVSVFTNVRGMVNARNIPSVVGKMATEAGISWSDTGIYNVDNVRLKSMAWGEIGVTYGKILKAKGSNMWTGAISLKRLYGFQYSSAIVDDALVHVEDLEGGTLLSTNSKYSYAEPDFNAGRGWGTNLGVTYKKMKKDVTHYVPHSKFSGCESIDYQYKIGVSLLDFGYINFKQGAYYGTYTENTNIDEITSAEDVTEETLAQKEGDSFTAILPAAASIQFDYNINDKVYLNSTIIQRIPSANTFGVERANLLAVSARYERKYFGVGLPITLYNYTTPQVGLSFRFANLTVGSDNVLPFIVKHDIYGADIYFSLKYTIFKSPACRDSKSRKSGRRGAVDCPAWEF